MTTIPFRPKGRRVKTNKKLHGCEKVMALFSSRCPFRCHSRFPWNNSNIFKNSGKLSLNFYIWYYFYPSAFRPEGYCRHPFCPSVTLFVYAITRDRFDLGSPILVYGLTLVQLTSLLFLRGQGQRSRSPDVKMCF